MTTLPLDFPPLLAEAERLAQEIHDAGVDDESIVPRWDGLSPPMRTRLVTAQARLLANPNHRDSRAWMAEWIGTQIGARPEEVVFAASVGPLVDASEEELLAFMLLLRRCGVEPTEAMTPGDILVACVLALHRAVFALLDAVAELGGSHG